MPRYRLVVDLATDRVVFFTDDPDQELHTDQYTALAEYEGQLPTGLEQRTSWNWRFRNQRFENTVKRPSPVSLLDQNRKSMLEFVDARVDGKLNALVPRPSRVFQHLLTLDAARLTLAQANRSTVRPSRFLTLYGLQQGLETEDTYKQADHFMQAHNELIGKVIKLEELRIRFKKEVYAATDSPSLFKVRDAVFEELK